MSAPGAEIQEIIAGCKLVEGDCLAVMRELYAKGVKVDAVLTDPPYHLTSIVARFGKPGATPARSQGPYGRQSRGFMGQRWDGGDIAFRKDTWRLCLQLLKPGGHLLAFSSTRGYHRMAVAIEDGGFTVRDMCAWVYGTGWPKTHNISKAIDKAAGAERKVVGRTTYGERNRVRDNVASMGYGGNAAGADQRYVTAPATESAKEWDGWGTALKPALEPLCLAQKPIDQPTIAENCLAHGVGGLNTGACSVDLSTQNNGEDLGENYPAGGGRHPSNLQHDGSADVLRAFDPWAPPSRHPARFFYCPKASTEERVGSEHPTVKPIALLRHYARLICPRGGLIFDPFAGTGTTAAAALMEGMEALLIENDPEYSADIKRRMRAFSGRDEGLFAGLGDGGDQKDMF